ncbi:hypothetical protein [Streptomyces sp. AC602_WCS936]|uniref:hypothetical protein n=1 Tax=Streptomyces sp. AC602_WCS936 TaxID=2823685 RepID=UPI001C27D242|nr:hypothetical protein [Streptomyces sp. AC602_WCS936]
MSLHTRRTGVAALALLTLSALSSCSSDTESSPAADHKPTTAPPGPSDDNLVAKNAHAYMVAWHAHNPADAKAMCELSTRAHRPNFDDDGGTIAGCRSSYWKDIGAKDDDSTRAPLTIRISHVQDVPASLTHPAGKGVLATGHRAGEDPWRDVLRLVEEDGAWRVEQVEDDDPYFAHTADPVAAILAGKS